jgi:subtilisin family serine protease
MPISTPVSTSSRPRITHTFRLLLLLALLSLLSLGGALNAQRDINPDTPARRLAAPQPTDTWVVRLAPGENPDAAAATLGMVNVGPLPNLPGYYRFRALGLDTTSAARATAISGQMRAAPNLTFAQQLVKREYAKRIAFNDPYFDVQWHLDNQRQYGVGTVGEDINVTAAWDAGFSGAGVVIGIIDDGPEYTHPDLADNWLAAASYDYYDGDADPAPEDDTPIFGEAHGTSVAGIAAAADNDTCGVGVAYNASIAGLRLVAGAFDDAQAAGALAHAIETVDIYNNSWGPFDDGVVWDDAGPLARAAIERGIAEGRDGKGIVYVWAAGNGGVGSIDHSGADGYVNNRYTIAVAASAADGKKSSYSELGAGLLVNAPSSGAGIGTVTSDRAGGAGYSGENSSAIPGGVDDCTDQFGGTSSSAPVVAGVVALMLEANPDLTWRDVIAVLIESAEQNDLADADWTLNGAGYAVNHKYGFGRVDAAAAVALAQTWTNLAPEIRVESAGQFPMTAIPDGGATGLVVPLEIHKNVVVEGVQLVVTARHARRGDLKIELISPAGTVSTLLLPRKNDSTLGNNNFATADIRNYGFKSMRHFGENAAGVWTARIIDTKAEVAGQLNAISLRVYGTSAHTAQDLVVNGGFELNSAAGKRPDGWTGTRLKTYDQWVTDSAKAKVADEGISAFQMTGRAGKPLATLAQALDGSALAAGDTLVVSARVRPIKLGPGARLRLRATYADGTKARLLLPIPTGERGYLTLTDALTLADAVSDLYIEILIGGGQAKGKVYIDAVRVERVINSAAPLRPAGGWLPLPAAP